MVIVFTIASSIVFFRIEEKFSSQKFKCHASQRPHIGRKVVFGTEEYFRTSVLTSLNFSGKVMVLPAGITEVSYLDFRLLCESTPHSIEGDFMFEIDKQLLHRSFHLIFLGFRLLYYSFVFAFLLKENRTFLFPLFQLRNLFLSFLFQFFQLLFQSLAIVMRLSSLELLFHFLNMGVNS